MPARTARTSTRRAKTPASPVTPQPEMEKAERKEDGRDEPKTSDGDTEKKKGKTVRDTFTMPAHEYELIRALKRRCLGLGVAVKKSELLRAGIAILDRLSDDRLTQAVSAVDGVKTGRVPGKKKGR